MGTNYYIKPDKCPHCGRSDERKHIGKSSAGWCFSLHVYPDEGINDLDDWLPVLQSSQIVDEYGHEVSVGEMLATIRHRSRTKSATPYGYMSWEHFHNLNHSQDGPNGCLRHRIDSHCVKHGAGTWDCIVGDFS